MWGRGAGALPRSATVPPFTGVFSLSFFGFTAEEQGVMREQTGNYPAWPDFPALSAVQEFTREHKGPFVPFPCIPSSTQSRIYPGITLHLPTCPTYNKAYEQIQTKEHPNGENPKIIWCQGRRRNSFSQNYYCPHQHFPEKD